MENMKQTQCQRDGVRRFLNVMVWLVLIGGIIWMPGVVLAQTEGVVHAVFFYSPSCPHCHEVMTNVFPALRDRYGEQLHILEVDTATTEGQLLYQEALDTFAIPDERRGVPTLIVSDEVMVGSVEIPERFPGLIETYLAQGGMDWPPLSGLEGFVSEDPEPVPEFDPDPDAAAPEVVSDVTWRERFMHDALANSIAVLVLIGLLASVVAVAQPQPWQRQLTQQFSPWALPVVGIVGLVVAIYLSYVELTLDPAVWCPVGDCVSVHQSDYAELFGFLPVSLFGVMGYILILALAAYRWWLGNDGRPTGWLARWSPVGIFFLTLFGTLFSAYLTFLEPFVIGATCMWCLVSAVCMALMLVLSAGPAWNVLKKKRPTKGRKRVKRVSRGRF
jgi:uncharacterized membrane protein